MGRPCSYPSEQIQWLRDNYTGRTQIEILDMFYNAFGVRLTKGQLNGVLSRNQIVSGLLVKFSDEQVEFIRSNIAGTPLVKITNMFNARFETARTAKEIKAAIDNRHLKNGIPKKGRPSPNKGKKFPRGPNWDYAYGFKPGQAAHNKRELGSESKRGDGYVIVKMSDDIFSRGWKYKHVVLWEAANGPVPEGCRVIFADGNKHNFNIDNLILVTKAECGVMNLHGFRSSSPDLTKAGLSVARLSIKIKERVKAAQSARQSAKTEA
ncbi:MAG: HNH endonuclease [Clostridiales bacterium]|jgi:hypothetical protein|nr:HNH endonuclease [Clostridiales bacterium]